MSTAGPVERGRAAFERRAWHTAYDELTAADQEGALGLDDLERLAKTGYLIGLTDVALQVRAYHVAVDAGQPARAARIAFWIGLDAMDRGDTAQASGWIARARRILEGSPTTVEHGYVLLPDALQALETGDLPTAADTFGSMAAIAERFGDPDLATMARLGLGQTLVRRSEIARGLGFLDEAMVAVTADELSPMVVGIVYCSVLQTCHDLFDVSRANEWTEAMARWCATQPDLVPYRGQCLLHRAELLQLDGSWADAAAEADRAREWLSRPPPDPAAGAAAYQQAELHRLRGEDRQAADRYREAGRLGHPQEPGSALAQLAQGDVVGAFSAIRRALDEAGDPIQRPRLLDAFVEIALEAGDRSSAGAAAAELSVVADDASVPLLSAIADRAEGSVRLADDRAEAALPLLRRAFRQWQSVHAPYEAAKSRLLIGLATRALGDEASATLELGAARETFVRLGARPDLARLDRLAGRGPRPAGGLTARELEILRLVATGLTNRAIATELVISEKTVARHLSNIFTKLDVTTRSAATAYAYQHGLVPSRASPT
jgi:DNA-binding CsgD family transcriptional regulator